MAYKKKGASKIVKNYKMKISETKLILCDCQTGIVVEKHSPNCPNLNYFNKNHEDDFNKKVEEIKHNGNHGKDTFGV